MFRKICLFHFLILISAKVFSQDKLAEMVATPGFAKGNAAAGYYLKKNSGYIVNLQTADKINRHKYDSNFRLTDSFQCRTIDYTLNQDFINTPVFSTDLQLENVFYELYIDRKKVIVIAPDFQLKKDSIVLNIDLRQHEPDEKRLAVMPFSQGLRILGFSNNRDKLFLFQWNENGQMDTIEFTLPKSSLSAEELKKYSKDVRVKYKNAFDGMQVASENEASIVSFAGANSIYYNEDKIWLVSQTPLYTGFHILELDIRLATITASNFFINEMRKNAEAKSEALRKLYALIWNNQLIVRNSSNYIFNYYFFDLKTKQKIKEYTAGPDKTLQKLLHSDLNQKGTWLSGKQEKEIDNEKAFLRKISSGDGFITLSAKDKDSITLTTGCLKVTEGIEGLVVGMASRYVGFMLGFTIGNFQLIPYFQMNRNKLIYSHSRFSGKDFEISTSKNITTPLDNFLGSFEKRDLKSNSTFLLQRDEKYLVAIYNTELKKFELYKIENE